MNTERKIVDIIFWITLFIVIVLLIRFFFSGSPTADQLIIGLLIICMTQLYDLSNRLASVETGIRYLKERVDRLENKAK